MGRAILSVVAGYLALALWVMVTLALAWTVLGASFAFEPGTTEVTLGWIFINLPLSLLGAVLGGWVAAAIGRCPTNVSVKILAILVLVLGLGMAIAHVYVDPVPGEREAAAAKQKPPEEMSGFEASSEAIQPAWYNFTVPLIGVAGVLLGGEIHRRRKAGGGD